MRKPLFCLAYCLFLSITIIQAQKKYLSGTVKAIHVSGNQTVKPLPNVRVSLFAKKQNESLTFNDCTDNSGRFSFLTYPYLVDSIKAEYSNFVTVQPEPGSDLAWMDNQKFTTYVLLCDPKTLAKIETHYELKIQKGINIYRKKIQDSLYRTVKNPLTLEAANQKLQQEVISLRARAKLYATAFSRFDTSVINPAYLKAFSCLLKNEMDSVRYYLDDEIFMKSDVYAEQFDRMEATMRILTAQLKEQENNVTSAEKYYKSAIDRHHRYYTFDAYGNFLMRQRRLDEADSIQELKLDRFRNLTFADSITTYYQRFVINSDPLYDHLFETGEYSEMILDNAQRIKELKDPLMGSMLIAVSFNNLADQSDEDPEETDTESFVTKTLRAQKLLDVFGEDKLDSLGVWSPGRASFYSLIGQHYLIRDNQKMDSAIFFFKKAFTVARQRAVTRPTLKSVTDLEMNYFLLALNDDLDEKKRTKLIEEETKEVRKKWKEDNLKAALLKDLDNYRNIIKNPPPGEIIYPPQKQRQ